MKVLRECVVSAVTHSCRRSRVPFTLITFDFTLKFGAPITAPLLFWACSGRKWILIPESSGSQSVVRRPTASPSSENLLDVQVIGPSPVLVNQSLWGWDQQSVLTPRKWFRCPWSLRPAALKHPLRVVNSLLGISLGELRKWSPISPSVFWGSVEEPHWERLPASTCFERLHSDENKKFSVFDIFYRDRILSGI